MEKFLDRPTIAVFRSFQKGDLLVLARRLGLTDVKVAMRKPKICWVTAEYYYDEEVFIQVDLDLFPPSESVL